MISFFRNKIVDSNKGISIILAIIIIIMLGLAGSIFAYLIASGSIASRSNLLSAEAQYAAKSGIEMTLYELEQKSGPGIFSSIRLSDCPTNPVLPPGVNGIPVNLRYISGNLQGNLPRSVNYTPTFCSVEGKVKDAGNCAYYIITSNGFAGGTKREVTAEVGVSTGKNKAKCVGIYVESEPSNSN